MDVDAIEVGRFEDADNVVTAGVRSGDGCQVLLHLVSINRLDCS
ncbi:hypothetical protein [Azospirillum baldaniorum]|nr:hypothetical protein [Azospirillum baldaniorum]